MLLVLLTSEISWSQNNFIKFYGGALDDRAKSMRPTSDKGYIIAGYTGSFGAGGRDFYLVKTDSAGSIKWLKTYGTSKDEEANSVRETFDKGYVLVGSYLKVSQKKTKLFYSVAFKTDSLGNILWSKIFPDSSGCVAQDIWQTTDSGYVLACNYKLGFNTYLQLIKINSLGVLQWSKVYMASQVVALQQTSDGGLAILGTVSGTNIFLLKTDPNGNALWYKNYLINGNDQAYSFQQTNDGGFIITGQTGSQQNWITTSLIKTDPNGNYLWSKVFSMFLCFTNGRCVSQLPDGGFIIGSNGTQGNGTFLIRTDALGNIVWSKQQLNINYSNTCIINSVYRNYEGDYVLAGFNFANSISDVIMAKTDTAGNLSCYTNNISFVEIQHTTTVTSPPIQTATMGYDSTLSLLTGGGGDITNLCALTGTNPVSSVFYDSQIFPNPAGENVTIMTERKSEMKLYNMLGQQAGGWKLEEGKNEIGLKDFAKGIYSYLLVTHENKITTGKLVIQ